MSGLNEVKLIGNMGQDAEINSMNNGVRVANLSIATSETWKDKTTGEKKEKTEWHRVVIFGKLVDVIERYTSKGSKLYICGKLQTRKWQDKDGNDKYTTEIVLSGFGSDLLILSGWKDNTESQQPQQAQQASSPPSPQDLDDDIPF